MKVLGVGRLLTSPLRADSQLRVGDFAHGCLRVLEGLAVAMDEVSPSIHLTLLVAFPSGSADCESSAD